MPHEHPLVARLSQLWPPNTWRDVTVLLAVSGGPDSVALLRAMASLGPGGRGRLVVAHFNHQLRGEEAAADEAFVLQLSRQLGMPCEVGRAQPGGPPIGKQGPEGAARRARYRFLKAAAERLGARYVATAHTADDQAETVLHHIVRGAGLAGLAGIPRARPLSHGVALIRPLLEVRRSELASYLAELAQPFREDSSNRRLRFTRNRIRHKLLPALAAQYNEHVADALSRLARLASEAQSVINELAAELGERSVREEIGGRVTIDCEQLAAAQPYVVREMLIAVWRRHRWPQRDMGYGQWLELASLLLGPQSSGAVKKTFPGGVSAQRRERSLVLQLEPGRPGR